ncbi:MAG: hypothetical protein GY871_15570, partial [Actinomycetales bacterium]|nr:hypothetical protein [Actinomycetales bacterium]
MLLPQFKGSSGILGSSLKNGSRRPIRFASNRDSADNPRMSFASIHRRRRDLRLLVVDGSCYSMMTGAGEWQFVLFALALGMGE